MDVTLENVEKKFGSVYAVKNLNLHIPKGEMIALLGPSGCGKTTTLFMLAGIYRPTQGVIRFGNDVVNFLRPQDRKIGMVFQSYALYPHMSAFDNIAFPLSIKKMSSNEIKKRVADVAELVQIGHLLERKPAELSGGQQQRVSLARALVKEPEILLLDEPLSNLDASLRMQMRTEIHKIQRELGITSIFVTHDQTEAMTMADKIALMKDGALVAYGRPLDLYERPEHQFVAQFLGSPSINLIPASIKAGKVIVEESVVAVPAYGSYTSEGPLKLGIRPEHLILSPPTEGDLIGEVVLSEALGHEYLYTVTCGEHLLRLRTPDAFPVKENEQVGLKIDWRKVNWFNEKGDAVYLNIPRVASTAEQC